MYIIIKRACLVSLLLVGMMSLSGCIKPYNKPSVVQIETNETAFLVDMRSDSSATTDSMVLIQRKDVIIDGYWVKTGRFNHNGHYRPTARVLVVSRRPVEVRWDGENNNPIVRAVSSESVGFQVPLVLNATIENDENAQKYLNWFRSNTHNGEVNIKSVREEAEALEVALNRVIYPIINNVLSGLFLEVPIIEAESQRVEFVKQAFETAKLEAEKYGITLLILSSTDGLLYDDSEFQNRINELAVAKMRENVLIQENLNAIKAKDLAETEANTVAAVAAIMESTLGAQKLQAEIEGLQLIYQAEAEAIKRRAGNAWPSTLIIQDLDALGQLGLITGGASSGNSNVSTPVSNPVQTNDN